MAENEASQPPVITVDGPSGSGKSTIARLLANHLQWHFLDSGALYRCVAFLANEQALSLEDPKSTTALVNFAENLQVLFQPMGEKVDVIIHGKSVGDTIRSQAYATAASKIAANPAVRQALLKHQHDFRQQPGLIADGRDMGTVVFPDANLKLFITASPAKRAERRFNQLKHMGIHANLGDLTRFIAERDDRDRHREIAPLRPAEDATMIDTTTQSVNDTMRQVMQLTHGVF